MLDSLVNASLQLQVNQLSARFQSAAPFPHLVLEELFAPELVQGLSASFPAFAPENARNELGEVGRKAVVQNLPGISAAYRDLDRLIASKEWLHFLGLMTGMPGLLYDPTYVGGGTHENLSGQELDYHVDFNYHPEKKWHRRLNLILFLNPEWDEAWGGNLQLHRDAWSDSGVPDVEVLPRMGRCVVFETSERSWHGFQRVQLPDGGPVSSRKSVALYFYSEERPEEEVQPEHSTFYVGRPLPSRMEDGYRLNEDDVAEIRSLLRMRDEWVEFLYRRELAWSTEFGRLREQLADLREKTDQYRWVDESGSGPGLEGPHGEFLPLRKAREGGLEGAVDVVRAVPSGDTLVVGWALDAGSREAPRAIAVFSGPSREAVSGSFELVNRDFPPSRAELGIVRHWKVGFRVVLPGSVDVYWGKGVSVFAVFRDFATLLPLAPGDPEKLAAASPDAVRG